MPVLLPSGSAIQQDEERIHEAGIDRVLSKPCPLETLLEAVAQTMRAPAPV